MARITAVDFPKEFDAPAVEERCRRVWEVDGIYRYDPSDAQLAYSVDTPPPYVSAAHLHVGHAMSYVQAEILVRFHRMKGRNIFYPMGFDDNGLPTERFVETTHKINKRFTTRKAFRALCLEETRKGAAEYEQLWRALGLSVDWSLRYSTIDDHCRRTSQKSFIALWHKGRIYRSTEPVLWDTHFETALAQADLETTARTSSLHDIAFAGPNDQPLIISTTRPEMLPACVALYCNVDDSRYSGLVGSRARVPLFGHSVPILADEDVLADFGTGLMMVCTFGDAEDVRRWKRDRLETRLCLGPDGKLTDAAGRFAGLKVEKARTAIVEALTSEGAHRRTAPAEQSVSVSERSGAPVEFMMVPQWFVRLLDLKEALLERSGQLRWHPDWMKTRLDQWIVGLKYDWNISRQRFYGVPIPVWYCSECKAVALPDEADLPVDPTEDACPVQRCAACGSQSFEGESDVMDTWMTSSLTPFINSNWAQSPDRPSSIGLVPMTVRVQAFEIIRTWLFYTLFQAHVHADSLPWRDAMISGWGLNEQGKKISKRDLEKFTDTGGFNRYEPYAVIRKYGADALRYFAAGSHLGHDTRYNEQNVKDGRRLVIKLWNAARFVVMQLEGFDSDAERPSFSERTPEDRWVLVELNTVLTGVTAKLEVYDYAGARELIDRFFWALFCDDYLEIVKDRFWTVDRYDESARLSARATLFEALRTVLALYAPFVPFVTEEIYQRIYRSHENRISLHVAGWPDPIDERNGDVPEMTVVTSILKAVRRLRTLEQVPQTRRIACLVVDLREATAELASLVRRMEPSLLAANRADELRYEVATGDTDLPAVKIAIVATHAPLQESSSGNN